MRSESKRTATIRDPQTPEEWQDAADTAEMLLALDSCKQYGLITGGPVANVDRCIEILDRARALGITPADAVTTMERLRVAE